MNRFILSVLLASLAAVVIACGGGGGAEAPAPQDSGGGSAPASGAATGGGGSTSGGAAGGGDPYAGLPEINLSPTGSDALGNPDFNFDRTPLVTGVQNDRVEIKLQFACINNSVIDCGMMSSKFPGEDIGFVERVKQRTDGQLIFLPISFPELGIAGPDTVRLIEDGTMPVAQIYAGYVGGDFPLMDISNLWGLYPSAEAQLAVIDAVQPEMDRITRENGGVQIGYTYTANNYFFSKRPVRSLDEFNGLKSRSHSTVLSDLISGLGGEPQFIAFADVYTALERGVIDAAVSCGSCGYAQRWYEVADYLVGPIVSIGNAWMTINADTFDELPKDFQNIVLEEGARHAYLNRTLLVDVWTQRALDDNQAEGMEFLKFTDEMTQAQRQAALDIVVPNWLERAGGPGSEGAKLFNEKVSPIVNAMIDESGNVAPTGGATAAAPAAGAPSGSGETQLVSEGYDITLQYVCVNRTLRPCELVAEFIKGVEERTNGQVTVNLSSYPELGISGFDMIRLINDGTVEFGEIYSGFVAGDFPIFNITNIWGLADSPEQYLDMVEAVKEDLYRIVTRESGGQVVFRNFYPSQYFYSKRPLNTLEDFQGMKTRVHSPVLGDLISALGADDQTMAFAEVYTALERGILDAGVTAASAGYGQRWYEVTDYLTGPFIGSFAQTFITVNGDSWAEIPEDLQQILLEEGRKHEERNLEAVYVWDEEAVGQNIEEGIIYTEFSPEMHRILKDAAINEVLPKWIERAGGPGSEAGQLYNDLIAPISGVVVNPDGTATRQ